MHSKYLGVLPPYGPRVDPKIFSAHAVTRKSRLPPEIGRGGPMCRDAKDPIRYQLRLPDDQEK